MLSEHNRFPHNRSLDNQLTLSSWQVGDRLEGYRGQYGVLVIFSKLYSNESKSRKLIKVK